MAKLTPAEEGEISARQEAYDREEEKLNGKGICPLSKDLKCEDCRLFKNYMGVDYCTFEIMARWIGSILFYGGERDAKS